MNENQHIQNIVLKKNIGDRIRYQIRLTANCIRFLVWQGVTFRRHVESEDSSNQGNFLKLLTFLAVWANFDKLRGTKT